LYSFEQKQAALYPEAKTEFKEPKPPTEEMSEEYFIYPETENIQPIIHGKDSRKETKEIQLKETKSTEDELNKWNILNNFHGQIKEKEKSIKKVFNAKK
jgi:hypothetical protein